jgi:DNA-binding beta-propeller fold protein YncE
MPLHSPCHRLEMLSHRSKKTMLLVLTLAVIGLAGCGKGLSTIDAVAADGAAAPNSAPGADTKPAQPAADQSEHPFPQRAVAPGLDGGQEWLNTSAPVDLKDLRGKFVLLDFWTYCCINCMHILPELKKLEQAYPNNVVVIGVHSGKFDTEHDSQSIRQAIMRYEIEHPVVNDADYKIWDRYHCRSWPSLRLIDPEGNEVAQSSGEIDFATLDAFVKKVLPYYRQKGVLNEKPIHFDLERSKAVQTPLRYPGKILADEAGNRLFIADSNHNRIVVASLIGKLQTVIGSGAIGKADGDFSKAEFNHPQGMALSGNTLYVADTENHLLRKVDLKTQRVTTIAGIGEEAHNGWPGVDMERGILPERFVGPPLKTALNSPWALWIQGKDLYIAMAGSQQIWKMPLDESEIGPFAGNGREDIVDGALLPKQPYQSGFSSFAQSSGLSSDGKMLFVADSEGSSVRAVPFDAAGAVTTLIGTAQLGDARLFTFGDIDGQPGKARLQHCLDVAYHDGVVYVADTYNHKIKAIDLKTNECKTVAGVGKPGHDDSAASHPAGFFEPAGLSYAAGKLFVADTNNHAIRVIDLANNNRVSTLTIPGLTPPAAGQTAN